MAAPLNIPALVVKLSNKNSFEVVYSALDELVDALNDDPDAAGSAMARAGGTKRVLDVMQKWPHEMPIQGYGCAVLNVIVRVNDTYRQEICHRGGIKRLVFAVKTFKDDENVRQQGLSALHCLVNTAPTAIAGEGISIILKAVESYLEDNITQKVACPLLSHLTRSLYQEEDAAASYCASFIINAGCFPVLIASLNHSIGLTENDQNDTVVPRNIMLTFTMILSSVEGSCHQFGQVDGFRACLNAMRKWNDCCTIQPLGCTLVAMISPSQENAKANIIEAGGVQLILDALIQFQQNTTREDNETVTDSRPAISALAKLTCDNCEAASMIHGAMGLPVLVGTMQKAFPNASAENIAKLRSQVMALLLIIARLSLEQEDGEGVMCSDMVASGVIPAILLAMQQFPNDFGVQYNGCLLLQQLIEAVDGAETLVVIDGGRKILKKTLAQHADDEGVEEVANEILHQIEGVDDEDRCHQCLATSEDLMLCSRCKKVLYCSRECQKEDYKLHKKVCKQLASLDNNATRS